MRTRVKICGITGVDDALAAARLGADAIGLVFYPQSPRAVTVEQARTICRALPPFVTAVGLFVNAPATDVWRVLDAIPLGLLQFHGDEPGHVCAEFGMPYVKAVRMAEGVDLAAASAAHPGARGLLLDTYVKGLPGGTGQVFDWGRVPAHRSLPLVLAGGLNPGNVAEAIARTRPYAVDVSGGVETAPGIKDAALMAAFMRGVNNALPTI